MSMLDLALELLKTGAKTATVVYNKVAEQLPIPLPRLGEEPAPRWEPPPPPPRPTVQAQKGQKAKKAAPPVAKPAPTPAAPKTGIQVDASGPTAAEYRKANPKPAAPAKKKKAAPAKKKAAPAKKKAAPAKKQDLSALTKAELQSMCKKAGKPYTQRMNKTQLSELLR
ncbi:MAG: hypothetical protein ACI9WU_003688 [Myxococcota bacterium]|jgi:hypothetical protein